MYLYRYKEYLLYLLILYRNILFKKKYSVVAILYFKIIIKGLLLIYEVEVAVKQNNFLIQK